MLYYSSANDTNKCLAHIKKAKLKMTTPKTDRLARPVNQTETGAGKANTAPGARATSSSFSGGSASGHATAHHHDQHTQGGGKKSDGKGTQRA